MDFVDDADHLNHKYNLLMNRKMYEGADVENEDCGDQKEKRPRQMSPIHLCIFNGNFHLLERLPILL